jgi:hypothetical protein
MYLSGFGQSARSAQAVTEAAGMLGYLVTPAHGRRLSVLAHAPAFACDNGCYSAGDRFNLDAFLSWLDDHAPLRDRCLFAVAPDVVGDAVATWRRSAPILPELRRRGFRAALVAQDGWDAQPVNWEAFDALFVGGTTEFKLSERAYALVREAKGRGKWCHMGRCNSRQRLRAAFAGGYDSADGTMLSFKPDARLRQLLGWLDELRRQPSLPLVA